MVHKRAVRKQQDTSQPADVNAARRTRPAGSFDRIADAFNAAVAQCVAGRGPGRGASLENRLAPPAGDARGHAARSGPAANALEQPARAWLRQLKQIRRAAGAVRDLDVQRKLLENWIGKRVAEHRDAGADASEPAASKQAEMLDAWLKGERKHLAHGMQKQIRKRQQGLAERQGAFLAAIARVPLGRARTPRPADAVALEDFVRAADAMPLLDAENLHDFRKATKKARYVAESGAEGQRPTAAWPRR